MVEDNIIEGSLKYRDGKKWKQRWAVLTKLSPVADVLQLQLFRDSRDRARGAPTKASLALPNSLALTTGFSLDKECHTLALLCKDLSLILAFDSRDRLLQWNSKISFTLGQEQQFLVQIIQVPGKSRLSAGPCRIHIRDHRFCLTSGTPPRLLAAWALIDLRRYGLVDGRFVWEGGSKSGRGSGVHLAISDAPSEITRAFDLASRGALGSKNRRGSSSTGTCGSIQRDAAMWLRDVGAIDMCQFSEAGDTVSIVPSEIGSILSPRSEFAAERRHDCDGTTGSSYVTGSSSSSGSLMGDDPGWWANTWTSRKGSMWEVGQNQPPESLYDSPKSFPHSHAPALSVANPPFSQQSQSHSSYCNHSLQIKHKHPKHHSVNLPTTTYQPPQPPIACVIANPMDNYDVPRPHYQHYDVPRKFATPVNIQTNADSCLQHTPAINTCGQMLCWAGSLMCSRPEISQEENIEPLKVNGEGKMPVLDAHTGTLVKRKPIKEEVEDPSSCQCHHDSGCEINADMTFEDTLQKDSKEGPIYAVVDKSKKLKLKPPTPTSSPHPSEEPTPTNPNPISNYENVLFQSVKSTTSSISNEESSNCPNQDSECYQCGGVVPISEGENQIKDSPSSIPVDVSTPSQANNNESKETHYILMGPGSPYIEQAQSHYLCMKNHSFSIKFDEKFRAIKRPVWKSGRSLSLARNSSASPSSTLRRSTSADSILHEPQTSSLVGTPDQTPNSTPITSPPISPFRSSTPRSESLRGRQRKRSIGQCSLRCRKANYGCIIPLSQSNLSEIILRTSTSPDSNKTTSVLSYSSNCVSQISGGTPNHNSSNSSVHHCSQNDGGKGGIINPIEHSYTIPIEIPCHDTPILRRSSSMPGKSANRDSASSSDSGVCESPKPHDRVLLSHCLHNSLPRGPRHQKPSVNQQHLKTGAMNGSCRELGPVTGDTKSSSSGTSDISDYLDTLSLSSHSSSDHERLLGRASVTTLRPRSGREYSRLDRSTLESTMLPPVGEVNCSTDKK